MEISAEEEYGNGTFAYYDDYIEICNREAVIKFGSIVVPTVFTIVVLLSLIGNILVLVVFGLNLDENDRSLNKIFILNLALSDLIFTLGLPFWACYHIWGWTFGDFMCKSVNFVFSAGFYSSIVFLMLMTIQRYVAIIHPLSYRTRYRHCSVIPLLFIAWVVSIVAAVPDLLYYEVIPDPDSDKQYCEYNSTFAIFDVTHEQNIFFVVAFFVMFCCYARIFRAILKSLAANAHKAKRLILCIVSVFFVCWAPYNIVIFLRSSTYRQIKTFSECDVSTRLDYAFYVCRLLAFSHCCLNPVIYCFVHKIFWDNLRTLLKKLFRC
ncbi:chemokine XC receptor 1-like [Colossoma macropomum]|uniref:chemokine XC receptor 1-like n=1 Tax=Colossoma macropomum TaxID=42526 RepID=UPI001864E6AF|nr:chemokine XC receptor 1-like [Colossoma macropomum]XP_036447602.1 chemokine XC receptor 1-like [Colossoma macropomum]XP_036447603.1 chemokine XC receptor 1-like [Colossoma macropomum]